MWKQTKQWKHTTNILFQKSNKEYLKKNENTIFFYYYCYGNQYHVSIFWDLGGLN